MKPNKIGQTIFSDVNLREIAAFIDWKFFFLAWRLTGKFDDIATVCDCTSCKVGWLKQFDEKDRTKAEEALKLFKDAQEILREIFEKKSLKINATVYLDEAYSDENDNIIFKTENGELKIPMLRQQHPSTDRFCYSLADFLAEKNDFCGAFVTTVLGTEEMAEKFEKDDDVYNSILIKTISDRLAEAAAEWLHFKIRKEIWGYVPDEKLSVKEMLQTKYQGIRPAVGYPSLPDQSIIFDLDKILNFNKIGVNLTENGAMFPNASVCGLYFAHPKSKYFMIGKIDENQLADYAQRKGKTSAELKKWLASNI